MQTVLLGGHGRVAAGGAGSQPLQQRLAVEQDVDLRGTRGGVDDAQGGIRFRGLFLGPRAWSTRWKKRGDEHEAQQGDPKDP